MGHALRKIFEGLDDRDDPVLQDTTGTISCRFLVSSSVSRRISRVDSVHLQFPGYPANNSSCQVLLVYQLYCRVLTARWKIHVLDWTRKRSPITRGKLAYEIAKKLERYLRYMAVRSYHNPFDFDVAYQGIIEICSGWISRKSVDDRSRTHAHRQYVFGPPCFCLEGIVPARDLGRGPFDATYCLDWR